MEAEFQSEILRFISDYRRGAEKAAKEQKPGRGLKRYGRRSRRR